MRIKRHEIGVILLTCAFACFLAGYFAGRRNAVNIVTLPPQITMDRQSPQQPGNNSANNPDGNTSATGSESSSNTESTSGGSTGNTGNTQTTAPPAANPPQQSGQTGAPRGGDGRININTATKGELMDLSGIGQVIAERIIDYRNRNGSFASIEDIMNVSGIGERRFEAIRDNITIG